MNKFLIVLTFMIVPAQTSCLPRSAKIGLGIAGTFGGTLANGVISNKIFKNAHKNADYVTAVLTGKYLDCSRRNIVLSTQDRLLGAGGLTIFFGGIGTTLFQLTQVANDYRKASSNHDTEDIRTENERLKTEIATLKNKLKELEAKNTAPVLT